MMAGLTTADSEWGLESNHHLAGLSAGTESCTHQSSHGLFHWKK